MKRIGSAKRKLPHGKLRAAVRDIARLGFSTSADSAPASSLRRGDFFARSYVAGAQKRTRRSYKRCRRPKARSTPAMESRTQVDDSRLESTSPFQGKETSPASDDGMDHASPS